MRIEPWAFDTLQTFWVPPRVWGYLLALIYFFLLLRVIWANRREWRAVTHSRLLGFLVALPSVFFVSGVLVVLLPELDILPLPNLPEIPPAPGAPLLGAVIILLVGGWLGMGPAVLVGTLSGLARALWLTGRGLQVVEVGLLAALVAFFLRQNYQGVVFSWLRRPIVAGLVGGLAAALLAFPSLLVSTAYFTSILPVVDFAWSLTRSALLPSLLEWLIAGLIVQVLFAWLPALRPERKPLLPPPHMHSLTGRFLFALIPIFLLTLVALVVVVTGVAINSTTDLTLKQMAHDARVASDAIPDLTLISTNLLSNFASQEMLLLTEEEGQQEVMTRIFDLEGMLRTTAFFRQVVLFDRAGQPVIAYPPLDDENTVPLVREEETSVQQAAILGYPSTTRVWVAEYGVPMLSHVESVKDGDGNFVGALMGRVDLRTAFESIVAGLQGTVGAGRGFVVDEEWKIIAHLNPDRLMQPWLPQSEVLNELGGALEEGDPGHAYEGIGADGTRQLVYYRTSVAHPWTVVIIVPYEHVLSLATEVAGPLTGFLTVGGLALAVVLALLTRRLNQPLSALAEAAAVMAHRDLETPILVGGADEVGRLGRAFEQMRQALQARLGELQLLLGVSQSVSAGLDLSRGLPAILDGALEATGSDGVRIVTLPTKERNSLAFAKGQLGGVMAPLDNTIARLLQRESSLRVDNTARTRALLNSDVAGTKTGQVGAILALPLRTLQGFQGILWIAFREPHNFTDSEVRFMTTLAGQASVLVENVQLFEVVEGEGRRLAAILASISDAVIVTDQHDTILLFNPAAEAAFQVSAADVMEQAVSDVLPDSELVSLLAGRDDDNVTGELELPDGRVLYASASTISGEGNQVMGRVVVLRDITYLKELDEMKTDFVNTVSHDLRSPLTYMRGYITMLPMIGELSAKQREYVKKVVTGIDQMTELVEGLLNLARIESDVDQLIQPVQVDLLVKAVAEGYQARAEGKGLAFHVETWAELPVIKGDPVLLRQAIANLVENAIKYTPSGEIRVRVYVANAHVVVQVQDTGPGVSQTDQAHLFERFYRVKRRGSLEIKGSGLGLTIVKSIAERRHSGRAWVESQLGVGSSFFIALPIE